MLLCIVHSCSITKSLSHHLFLSCRCIAPSDGCNSWFPGEPLRPTSSGYRPPSVRATWLQVQEDDRPMSLHDRGVRLRCAEEKKEAKRGSPHCTGAGRPTELVGAHLRKSGRSSWEFGWDYSNPSDRYDRVESRLR